MSVLFFFGFLFNLGAAGLSIYTRQWWLLPVNIGCALWMLALLVREGA